YRQACAHSPFVFPPYAEEEPPPFFKACVPEIPDIKSGHRAASRITTADTESHTILPTQAASAIRRGTRSRSQFHRKSRENTMCAHASPCGRRAAGRPDEGGHRHGASGPP